MPGENLTHEPDPYVLRDAAERAIRYRRGIRRRGVAPAAAAIPALAHLGGALPERGEPPEGIVALLDEVGSPATTASTGGRYFGFVTGGALPAAIGASWLATAWDQNAALAVMSPVAAEVERVAIR